VNAKDGTVRWQAPLHGTRADYDTPCVYQTQQGQPELVFTSMEDGVLALDILTGKMAWQLPKVFSQRCVSSPVVAGGLIVGSCGSGGGGNYVAAVRPPSSPGAKPELAYTIRKSAPYVPTSVALGNLLFLWSDAGFVNCVEPLSGAIHWQERVGGSYFASPICVDGRVMNVSASGEVVVLEASSTFHELGRNKLEEPTEATPAVSAGCLYIRTDKHLLCIGKGD